MTRQLGPSTEAAYLTDGMVSRNHLAGFDRTPEAIVFSALPTIRCIFFTPVARRSGQRYIDRQLIFIRMVRLTRMSDRSKKLKRKWKNFEFNILSLIQWTATRKAKRP